MKLEKFNKNQKQKKLIIGAIIGLIVLVGGITLYRTFALYEEKKEFNILKGKVPDFVSTSSGDIILSYTLNGTSEKGAPFPDKEDAYLGKSVTCNNGVTAEWNNVSWGLTNISNPNNSEKIICTIHFFNTLELDSEVKVGDYIVYTAKPTSKNNSNCESDTKCSISSILTGTESDLTMNPSNLNLWRVISINSDKTIDIISEYAGEGASFRGKTGYDNFVTNLTTIASFYETENLTTSSRYVGVGTTGCNWNTSSDKDYNVSCSNYTDVTPIRNVFGTMIAYSYVNHEEISPYWFGGKYQLLYCNYFYRYGGLAVDENGSIVPNYVYSNSGVNAGSLYAGSITTGDGPNAYSIRPIVTLSSGLQAIRSTEEDKVIWTIN